MEVFQLIYLVTGLLIGTSGAWFIAKLMYQNSPDGEAADKAKKYDELVPEKALIEGELKSVKTELERINTELRDEREGHDHSKKRLAKAEEAFKLQDEKIANQKKEIDELHEKFGKEFENIANRVLRQNTDEISKINKERLESTLKPLGERIRSFEDKIEKSGQEREGLKEQIKLLHDLNKNMAEEAKNLTNALKGDTKKQGNWGEIVLERILEESGLIKGQEYELEYATENQEGAKIRPDAIIKLPEKKHVIVDSKVSLVAYESFVNTTDKHEKEVLIKKHIDSVKSHVKILSEKSYQTSVDLNAPDFVLLFLPIEAAFSVAVQADPDVFSYAWDRKIVIVSPTTLLATLRTIASIWKQEKQTKNAVEIARQSGLLYDKFVGFVDNLKKIEDGLKKSQNAYDNAWKQLSDGSGNLIGRAEKIRQLGAKTSKQLDPQITSEQNEDEQGLLI